MQFSDTLVVLSNADGVQATGSGELSSTTYAPPDAGRQNAKELMMRSYPQRAPAGYVALHSPPIIPHSCTICQQDMCKACQGSSEAQQLQIPVLALSYPIHCLCFPAGTQNTFGLK